MNTSQTTTEQGEEFAGLLGEIKHEWSEIRHLPASIKKLQDETGELKDTLSSMRRRKLPSTSGNRGLRPVGAVSHECATEVAARFIALCAKSDMLEALSSAPGQRDAL